MKPKEKKKDEIFELQHTFQESKGIIVAGYKGLNVSEMNNLRVSLREDNLRFRVVKNTLARKASENTPIEKAVDLFNGPVGIAIAKNDPVVLSKKILDFSKNNDKLVIMGGIIEGKRYSAIDLKVVSELPSREVLLSMLVGTIQSPLSTFASLMQATIRQFLYALEGLKSKKSEDTQKA